MKVSGNEESDGDTATEMVFYDDMFDSDDDDGEVGPCVLHASVFFPSSVDTAHSLAHDLLHSGCADVVSTRDSHALAKAIS